MATKADVILSSMGIQLGEEMTTEQIAEVFKNFKEAKKIIEDYEKKTLKPFLFQSAEKLGIATESGGNKVMLPDGSGWEKQARVSVSVDAEKALALMKQKKLMEYINKEEFVSEEHMETVTAILQNIDRGDLISRKESVAQSDLEQAFLSGRITDNELGGIISRKITYALVEVKPQKIK